MSQITDILGNKASLELLSHFLRHATLQKNFSQLKKETRLSSATLAKALKRLHHYNLVAYAQWERLKLYTLQRDSLLVRQLKILDTLSMLLPLQDVAKRLNCSIYLFGSAARGEDTERSDIDFLILAEDNAEKIPAIIEKSIKTKRKIAIHIFTNLEWAQMARKDPAFYERVEKDKIQIA